MNNSKKKHANHKNTKTQHTNTINNTKTKQKNTTHTLRNAINLCERHRTHPHHQTNIWTYCNCMHRHMSSAVHRHHHYRHHHHHHHMYILIYTHNVYRNASTCNMFARRCCVMCFEKSGNTSESKSWTAPIPKTCHIR